MQVLKGIVKPDFEDAALENTIKALEKHEKYNLILTVLKNLKSKEKNYSIEMKEIALYFYINVGATFFEFLHRNLGLPSLSTTKRFLTEFEGVKEGKLRVNELVAWLEKHNLPKKVWISEDATRIVRNVINNIVYRII